MSADRRRPSPIAIPMAAPARSSRRETLSRLLRTPTFLIAAVVIVLLDVLRVLRLPHRSPRPDVPDHRHPAAARTASTRSAPTRSARTCSRACSPARASTMEIAPAATLISTRSAPRSAWLLGYFRGWFDEIVGRLIDAFLAIPGIIFLIAVITSLGTSVADADHHDRPGLHAHHRAHRARRRAGGGRAGLRAGREAARREGALHPVRRDPAEHRAPDHRRGHRAPGLCDLHGRRHHVPRPRPAAADARLVGRHHRGFPNLNDTFHDGYYWQVLFPGLAIISICVAVAMLADSLQQVFDR